MGLADFPSETMMTTQDKYERGPARGFSAAYDVDRARAEKELASTMAGPGVSCFENTDGRNAESRSC